MLAVISASGIALALLAARHRPPKPLAVDLAAAAASTSHTMPVPHPNAPERELVGTRTGGRSPHADPVTSRGSPGGDRPGRQPEAIEVAPAFVPTSDLEGWHAS